MQKQASVGEVEYEMGVLQSKLQSVMSGILSDK
jgi:hypothetical protein